MSDASTKKMIGAYLEESEAPLFLSGFFQSPPENFHTSEEVEFDIERDTEHVAIVIKDLSLPANSNQNNVYTNKNFKPPIYDEEGSITAFDMIKRQPGQNPFQDPDYGANAVRQAFRVFRKLEKKIHRAIELMASQVFASGVLTLLDQTGATAYALDFSPKATHYVNSAAVWAANGSTGDPLADIDALARVIRRDGKHSPDRLIFGATALQRFLANAKVQLALESRRMVTAEIQPQVRGQGATFLGWIWIGQYRYEMWAYDGFYMHPQTGTKTQFVNDAHVLVQSSQGRLDLTFGAIPMIVPPDQRVMPYLPARIASSGRAIDLTTNAWVTPNGKAVMVSAGTRPLTIPTAIDTFGRIAVTLA